MSHTESSYEISFQYDLNRDGYLEKQELKRLIKQNPAQCEDLPKGLAKAIMSIHDSDGDGRLDFDEFYKLSQEHSWLVHDWCVKYCRYVIPRRNGAVADETGENLAAATCSLHCVILKVFRDNTEEPCTLVIGFNGEFLAQGALVLQQLFN